MLHPVDLKRRILEAGLARPKEIQGCSNEEIRLIEKQVGLRLAKEYCLFLKTCGKGAGRFMDNMTVFYPAVAYLTAHSRELLVEEGMVAIPEDAYVFMMDLGHVFMFFRCNGEENPPVYCWREDWDEIRPTGGGIWHFVERQLVDAESLLRRLKQVPDHQNRP